jgi:hypothetical protein
VAILYTLPYYIRYIIYFDEKLHINRIVFNGFIISVRSK